MRFAGRWFTGRWFKSRWLKGIVALLLGGLLLSGCGRTGETGAVPVGAGETGAGEAVPGPVSTGAHRPSHSAPTLTSVPTTSPARSALQRAADKKVQEELQALKNQAAQGTTAKAFFTMPNVVGRNLQAAQDTLHARGSYVLDEHDARRTRRIQVPHHDWRVCSQKPAAGSRVLLITLVRLSAVKLAEKCP